MTNKLLADWYLHIKFVDDLSAVEILPRNSISLLNITASDIQNFSIEHNMKLNPPKCKEMLINFMHNPNFILRPIIVGNNVIERVSSYKILGVFVDSDLKWNSHIDYIYKKACKKLYSLRVLRRAGVDQVSILNVYISTVRPVLEYAVPVWQSIPGFLSDKIESIQKRALRIIFPTAEKYTEALKLAHLDTLADRRNNLCVKYMDKMKRKDHPLHSLLPTHVDNSCRYSLRKKSDQVYLFKNCSTCRTKRAEAFFTFKYF